jgi:hypothetical protein
MNRIIFLNGPPGCGKDTVGEILAKEGAAVPIKFAAPLRIAAAALYGIDESAIESMKAQKIAAGLTLRDFMIHLSEDVAKVWFGDECFGAIAAEKVCQIGAPAIAVTDAGFELEVSRCIADLPDYAPEIWHITRAGCSFAGDSRNYIAVPGVPTFDLDNSGNLADLRRNIAALFTREPY